MWELRNRLGRRLDLYKPTNYAQKRSRTGIEPEYDWSRVRNLLAGIMHPKKWLLLTINLLGGAGRARQLRLRHPHPSKCHERPVGRRAREHAAFLYGRHVLGSSRLFCVHLLHPLSARPRQDKRLAPLWFWYLQHSVCRHLDTVRVMDAAHVRGGRGHQQWSCCGSSDWSWPSVGLTSLSLLLASVQCPATAAGCGHTGSP